MLASGFRLLSTNSPFFFTDNPNRAATGKKRFFNESRSFCLPQPFPPEWSAAGFRLLASGFWLPASGFRLPASGFRLPMQEYN
jgi:hypothetical protein